jgi:hypothetical protein
MHQISRTTLNKNTALSRHTIYNAAASANAAAIMAAAPVTWAAAPVYWDGDAVVMVPLADGTMVPVPTSEVMVDAGVEAGMVVSTV